MRRLCVALVVAFTLSRAAVSAPITSGWALAKSPHFEVYTHSDAQHAAVTLERFEQLAGFFSRTRILTLNPSPASNRPLRVIVFSSKREYDQFKIRATADAYFVSQSDRSYVVMPPGVNSLGIAAHEYAHFVLHSNGLRLPIWLSEGIAEVFSTLTVSDRGCQWGGMIPTHVAKLRRSGWASLHDLSSADAAGNVGKSREEASRFYAESWSIADTLMEDPSYASRFADLVHALRDGTAEFDRALADVYHSTPQMLLASAQARLAQNNPQRHELPGGPVLEANPSVTLLSDFESGAMIADLLFANGESERSQQAYRVLLLQAPQNANILAALGAVALQRGNRGEALAYWRQALNAHVTDASMCYRYALLADQANEAPSEIKRALETAVELDPHLEDGHWRLALLLNNEGDFSGALSHLEAMLPPKPERAYGYWTTSAYALTQLGKNDEAVHAAEQAMRYAKSAEERSRAADLVYVAKTELAVRFVRTSDGTLRLSTTRVPRGTTEFNPFIEPNDEIRTVTGNLREVQCSGGRLTGLIVEGNGSLVTLSVPDPLHVLIRNGPSEFTCGMQPPRHVTAQYAAAPQPNEGTLRGMKF